MPILPGKTKGLVFQCCLFLPCQEHILGVQLNGDTMSDAVDITALKLKRY